MTARFDRKLQQPSRSSHARPLAGKNAAALTPPRYGIDFVDRLADVPIATVAATSVYTGASGPELMRQPRVGTAPRPRRPPAPEFARVFRWPQLMNSGASQCAPGVTLGVGPGGQLLNAMELVFTEQPAATERRRRLAPGGYDHYQVRQTLEERSWQFVGNQWLALPSQPAGTVDDPDPTLQCWREPEMRTVDTPGWSGYFVPPTTRRLIVNGERTHADATAVLVQQNFYTWIEGARVFSGAREVVSVRYPWSNNLYLVRASPTSPWQHGPDSRIQSGHTTWGGSRP
jgi:hypothetical protein